MKLPYFSLFSGKRDCETPESRSIADKTQRHLISKRLLLISLRSPSDQLQIVIFPFVCK
jgi:hypothetical protein